jgi:hypothetical protein
MKTIKKTPIAVLALSAMLAGCGGSKDAPPQLQLEATASIKERKALTLTAVATDDKSISSYEWKQIAGPTLNLSQTNSASVAITAPTIEADSSAQLKLTVTDSAGQTADKTITISILNNKLPTAIAENLTVPEKAAGQLKATVGDSDGNVTNVQWTQISGTAVTLSGANTATASFTAPSVSADAQLVFSVKATDEDNESSTATVTVSVAQQFNNYSVTGQGQASAFANSTVTAMVAGKSFASKADAQGLFTVKIQQDDDAQAPSFGHVKLTSVSITGLDNYAFVTDFVAEAKPSAFNVTAAPTLAVNELSTARFALIQQANQGKIPSDVAELTPLEKRVDPDEFMEAAAVSRIVANKSRELPQGVSLLQLLTNNSTYRNFIAAAEQADPDIIKKQIDALLADPALMPTMTMKDVPSVYYQTWAAADGYFPYDGTPYYFNSDGTGYSMPDAMPNGNYTWQIVDGAIVVNFEGNYEIQSYPAVTEEIATRLGTTVYNLNRLGIYQIRIRTKDVKSAFKLVQSGRDHSVFRQTLETSNTIDPFIAGGQSFSAAPLITKTVTNVLLKNGDKLPVLKFTTEEVAGNSFNISHIYSMANTNKVSPIFTVPVDSLDYTRMDLLNFKADGTGSGLISDSVFNWRIDNNGTLVILHADGDRTLVKKLEKSSQMTQVLTQNFRSVSILPTETVNWFIQYDPASLGGLNIANAKNSYWQTMINSWDKNCWVKNQFYTRCGSKSSFNLFFGFQFFDDFTFINHSVELDEITRTASVPRLWRNGPKNTIEFVRSINAAGVERTVRVYLPLKLEMVAGKRRFWVIESQVQLFGTPTQGYQPMIQPRINFFDELPLNTPDSPSAKAEQPRYVLEPSAVVPSIN